MKLLCFLWRHDWEVIASQNEEQIIEKINKTLKENIKKGNPYKSFHRKVCLRCGTKKDEINDFFTKFLLDRNKKKIRKQTADSMWRNI